MKNFTNWLRSDHKYSSYEEVLKIILEFNEHLSIICEHEKEVNNLTLSKIYEKKAW